MITRIALMALLILPALTRGAAAQSADESTQPGDQSPQWEDDLQWEDDAPPPAEQAPEPAEQAPEPAEQAPEPAEQAPPPAEQAPPPAEQAPPPFAVKGSFKLQSGVFVPLISSGFSPHENAAEEFDRIRGELRPLGTKCDPVVTPNRPCYALDHGQDPGNLSMGRGTLQLQATWTASKAVTLHATSMGVRAVKLPADKWAQIPKLSENPEERPELAEEWVLQNYYNEFELFRTLYIDAHATDWLSFQIGRQFWSGTGKYQLLDVVNPHDDSWHFGALEAFEENRTPLWMVTSVIDITPIHHSLELFWVPLIVVPVVDDEHDTVTVPLSLVGAWGIPYSNTPTSFVVGEKVFEYPGNRLEDMRAGVHWKGNLGSHMRYSLLYYYTHQLSPPIPMYYDQRLGDNTYLEQVVLRFPRQHIAGLSMEFAFESPIDQVTPPFGTPAGLVAKLEGVVEPDRTYAVDTESLMGGMHQDPDNDLRFHYEPKREVVVGYGVSLTRPTMIGFLNATAPFLLVGQFKHVLVPTWDEVEDNLLTEIPGYNDYGVETSLITISGAIATPYLRGFLVPKLIGAVVLPDSGFYSLDLGINFSAQLGMHLVATDFFGSKPYRRLGLFRDRDEVNLSVHYRF